MLILVHSHRCLVAVVTHASWSCSIPGTLSCRFNIYFSYVNLLFGNSVISNAHNAYRTYPHGLLCAFIEPAVDLGNLTHPPFPVTMLHVENRIGRPVEMVCNVGYLLVQAIQGVA